MPTRAIAIYRHTGCCICFDLLREIAGSATDVIVRNPSEGSQPPGPDSRPDTAAIAVFSRQNPLLAARRRYGGICARRTVARPLAATWANRSNAAGQEFRRARQKSDVTRTRWVWRLSLALALAIAHIVAAVIGGWSSPSDLMVHRPL